MKKLFVFLKAFWAMYNKKPSVVSIDITSKCNIKCPTCYWWTDRKDDELSDNDWISFAKKMVDNGIVQCTYVGGEPLLRGGLIEKLAKIIPINWVVTNGTFPIPELPNTRFIVSLDGTERVHDLIRQRGLYAKIKERISGRKDIITNTTIFVMNKNEPGKLPKEWSGTEIKGMTFNFATPMRDSNCEYLNDLEKNEVIDKLLHLKNQYGDFMLVSKKWLEDLRPEKVEVWHKKCPAKDFALSVASDGKKKLPCILGKNAICGSCGCHVPAIIRNIKRFDLDTFRILAKMI